MYALLGDGPLRPSLEALRDELGLTDKVKFFGFREDVASFYEFLDLGVLATLHPEGHSNFLLEAMMAGKPVVASDTGGTGLMVPRRDPEALAEAMLEILTDEEHASGMARAGQESIATKFGLDRMVDEYSDLYRTLLPRAVSNQSAQPRAAGQVAGAAARQQP